MLSAKNIAVLGLGTLGTALVSGLLKSSGIKPSQIKGTTAHSRSGKGIQLKADLKGLKGIEVLTDNAAAVKDADIVILAVKPQNMAKLLETIAPVIKKNQLIISVAAAIPIAYIEERLSSQVPVIRAMPNNCVAVSSGMTGLAAGQYAKEQDKKIAQAIFESVGEAVFIEEKLFNALTALSASGPAYLYVVIESLTEAGVKLGMSREIATLLAAQTMLGTAKMVLETGEHPALLKDAVTTPAGCTIDGLMELEDGKLRVTLIKAVLKAAERSKELLNS